MTSHKETDKHLLWLIHQEGAEICSFIVLECFH